MILKIDTTQPNLIIVGSLMGGRSRIWLNLFQNLIKTNMALILCSSKMQAVSQCTSREATVRGNDSPHFQKGILRIKETWFKITRNEVPHAASRSVLVWRFAARFCCALHSLGSSSRRAGHLLA